jgi:hypothetical protein
LVAAGLRLTRVDSLGVVDAAVYSCLIVVGLRFFQLLSSRRFGVVIQTLYCVVMLIAMLSDGVRIRCHLMSEDIGWVARERIIYWLFLGWRM